MSREWYGCEFAGDNFCDGLVVVEVFFGPDLESLGRRSVRDQLDDGPMGARGRPRQFIEKQLNIVWSILFHFNVPGGQWQRVISRSVPFASFANSTFQSLTPIAVSDPPASTVIQSLVAIGKPGSFRDHQPALDGLDRERGRIGGIIDRHPNPCQKPGHEP